MLVKGGTKRCNLKFKTSLENGNFDTLQRALKGSSRRGVLTRESCRGAALHAIRFSVFISSQSARHTVRPG